MKSQPEEQRGGCSSWTDDRAEWEERRELQGHLGIPDHTGRLLTDQLSTENCSCLMLSVSLGHLKPHFKVRYVQILLLNIQECKQNEEN